MLGVDMRSGFRDVTADFYSTVEARKRSPLPLPVHSAGSWSFLSSLNSKSSTTTTSSSSASAPSSNTASSTTTTPASELEKGKEREWTHRQMISTITPSTTKTPVRRSTTPFLELALQVQDRLTVANNNLKNLNQQLQKGFSAFDDGKQEAVITSVGRVVEQSKSDIQRLDDMLSNGAMTKNTNSHSSAHYVCILKQLKTKHHSLDQELGKARDKHLKNVQARMRTASVFFGQSKPATANSLVMHPAPLTIPKPRTQPLVHSATGQLELIDEPVTTFRSQASETPSTTTTGDQMLVVLDVKDEKMMSKNNSSKAATEAYYESRAEQAKGLLKSFEVIAKMFREVQEHVDYQGRQIDMVGYNVEQSALSIEKAEEELIKTVKTQASNRGLYAKLFGVLLLFIFVFFVFFV